MSGNNYQSHNLLPNQTYDARKVWGTETRNMGSGSLSDEIKRITEARDQMAFPYPKPQDGQMLQTGPLMTAYGDYSGFPKNFSSMPLTVSYDTIGGASIPTTHGQIDNATLRVLIQDIQQVMQTLNDKMQALELAVESFEQKQ